MAPFPTLAAEVVKILREEAVHIADHYSTLPAETMNEAASLIEAQDRVVRAVAEALCTEGVRVSVAICAKRPVCNVCKALAALPSRSRG